MFLFTQQQLIGLIYLSVCFYSPKPQLSASRHRSSEFPPKSNRRGNNPSLSRSVPSKTDSVFADLLSKAKGMDHPKPIHMCPHFPPVSQGG
ncbi:unnamed protein product [Linum trigynum]|uniref:Uncharacterized protein n=1 Tax=Linum trigynum TaxID=586398 RepID=A0AAV2CB37_9ROSI